MVEPDVVLLERRIEPATLRRLVECHVEDMAKRVVDADRGIAAAGCELS